jgi:hypothetical protein
MYKRHGTALAAACFDLLRVLALFYTVWTRKVGLTASGLNLFFTLALLPPQALFPFLAGAVWLGKENARSFSLLYLFGKFLGILGTAAALLFSVFIIAPVGFKFMVMDPLAVFTFILAALDLVTMALVGWAGRRKAGEPKPLATLANADSGVSGGD